MTRLHYKKNRYVYTVFGAPVEVMLLKSNLPALLLFHLTFKPVMLASKYDVANETFQTRSVFSEMNDSFLMQN